MKFKVMKLSDVATISSGNSAPQDKKSFKDGEFYFIRTSDVGRIKTGEINKSRDKLNLNAVKKMKMFKKGTILFPKSGASTFLNHRVIMNINGYVSSHLATIKAKKDILDEYLYYFLQLIDAKNLIEDMAYPSVKLSIISNIKIPITDLENQKKFLDKIHKIEKKLDMEKNNLNIKLRETDNLLKNFLIKEFNNSKYPKKKLGDICTFLGGSQPAKKFFEKTKSESNVRLIQIRDYKSDKNLVYIPKNLAKRQCNNTDVMIGRYGPPVFQILRGLEGSYNVALMKAMPDKKYLDNDYLFYFLKNDIIQNHVIKLSERAAGQSGLNKETLEPYYVYLPEISIQKKIVSKCKIIFSNIDKIKNNILSQENLINLLKIRLIKDNFNHTL